MADTKVCLLFSNLFEVKLFMKNFRTVFVLWFASLHGVSYSFPILTKSQAKLNAGIPVPTATSSSSGSSISLINISKPNIPTILVHGFAGFAQVLDGSFLDED